MRAPVHTFGSARVVGLMAAALFGLSAQAQSFPPESSWVPLRCGTEVMTDPFQDESGAQLERDLIGDANAATGFRAADWQYLFLRMRLDRDPIPGGNPRPFAWGLLLDTDTNLQNYELLLMANGIGGTVALYKNTTTTLPNDPTDPPDEQAVKTYLLSSHARSVVAASSSYGGDSDYFLDFAIPWQDLQAVGLTPSTPVTAWAATSSTSTALNGDFACFNDALGDPTLSGTDPGSTVLDPRVDRDGDGYTDATEYASGTDPNSASDHPAGTPDARQLAGGGGCTAASGANAFGWALLAWAAAFTAAAARRRTSRPDPTR
jgi:hypothetical protein